MNAALRRATAPLLVGVLLTAGATFAPSRASAAGDPSGQLDPCSTAVKTGIYLALEMTNIIPGFGLILRAGANLGKAGNYAHCRDGEQEYVTVARMIEVAGQAAGEAVDQGKLDIIEGKVAGIQDVLASYQPLLDRVGELNAEERSRLSVQMEAVGNLAAAAETEAARLGWTGASAVAVLAGMRNAAWVLAWELIDPVALPTYRHQLGIRIADGREATASRIRTLEEELRSRVRGLEIHREVSLVEDVFGRWRDGTIEAWVKDADGAFEFQEEFACRWEQEWDIGDDPTCTAAALNARAEVMFGAARAVLKEARADLVAALGPDYLVLKAAWVQPGEAFTLTNNRSRDGFTRCLERATDDTGAGERVRWGECDPGALPVGLGISGQVWRFVPGTARLQHVRSGRCLDVAGAGSYGWDPRDVRMRTCGRDNQVADSQSWGLHPLGYLVHTATGECLDVASSGGGPDSATTAALADCQYGWSSRPGGHDASKGVGELDAVSLQLWQAVPVRSGVLFAQIEGFGKVVGPGFACDAAGTPGSVPCGQFLSPGSTIELTAVATGSPATGAAEFVGWSGACAGADPTCVVTLDQVRLVTAHFAPPVRTYIQGSGSVTSDPVGLVCTAASEVWPSPNSPVCQAGFRLGSEVTLRAVPAEGSVFDRWYGACAGSGPECVLPVAHGADQTSTAVFVPPQDVLVARTGTGSGSVTSGEVIDCGETCSASLPVGAPVTFVATPATGSRFAGWSGLCATATGSTCTLTLAKTRLAQYVGARFDEVPPTVDPRPEEPPVGPDPDEPEPEEPDPEGPTAPEALAGHGPAVIFGTPVLGTRLRGAAPAFVPSAETLRYRWRADGAVVPGATSTTLLLDRRMLGKRITFEVVAARPGYLDGVSSAAATRPVAKASVRMTVRADRNRVRAGSGRTTVLVRLVQADGLPVTGTVAVRAPGSKVRRVAATAGVLRIKLPVFRAAGRKTVTVRYGGDSQLGSRATRLVIRVVR